MSEVEFTDLRRFINYDKITPTIPIKNSKSAKNSFLLVFLALPIVSTDSVIPACTNNTLNINKSMLYNFNS